MRLEEAEAKAEEYKQALIDAKDDERKFEELAAFPDGAKKFLKITKESLLELWTEAQHYYKHKELEKAVIALFYLMTFDPLQPTYEVFCATILYELKKIQPALVLFESAAKLLPEEPELPLYIGQCYLLLERPEAAKSAFEKCIEIAKVSSNAKAKDILMMAQNALKKL